MEEWTAEPLVECGDILGEGIQWDAATGRLLWTDIEGRRLLSCDAEGRGLEVRPLPDRLGSFALDPAGNLICAFAKGLFRWNLRDAPEPLAPFEPDHPGSRLNDGRCDRQGRFLAGGIDEAGMKPSSSLVRWDGRLEVLRRGVTVSNGLAFAPDGQVMYWADSPTGLIERRAYDPETGALGPPEAFHAAREGDGFPDGACTDAEGNLWSARWQGGAVLRIAPAGTVTGRVRLPVPRVTCACFGGAGLDRLFVTTARAGMDAAALAQYPLSGAVFVARPGARGLPEARYGRALY